MPTPALVGTPAVNRYGDLSFTVGAGANLLLGGMGSGTGGTPQDETLTYGGVAMLRIGEANDSDFSVQTMFRLLSPTVGTANIVGGPAGVANRCAVAFSGVDTGTPTGTTVVNTGTSAAASATITVGADSRAVAFLRFGGTGTIVTPADGTEAITQYTEDGGGIAVILKTGTGSLTFAPTFSASVPWQIVAVAVNGTAGSTPTVSGIAPTSGPIGTVVTVTGTNLTSTTAVDINGTAGTGIASNTATGFTFVVGAGTTSGALGLTCAAGSLTGGPTFTVTAAPVFTSIVIVTNANTEYTPGVTLSNIVVEKRDQFGAATTLGPTTATISEILDTVDAYGNPLTLTGTLTRTFSGAQATFNDIVPAIPVVTFGSRSPTSGPIGTAFTGTGTNILGATGARTANSINLTSFVVVNGTTFTGVIPAGATSGAITLLHPYGNVVGPTFTVATGPVANALRFVSPPDPIIAGTTYELQVEAIDTTLGDIRVTSFTGNVTIGIDIAVPVGFEISSGVLTRAAVAGLATFPGIVFAETSGPVVPPPVLPPVSTNRKATFATAPSSVQVSGALFSGSVTGAIETLDDVVDTAFNGSVLLVIRSGAGSVIGNATVTAVAGLFTFAAVGVRLTENVTADDIYLGIFGYEGQTLAIPVRGLELSPDVIVQHQPVPRASSTPPVAVVQIVGPIAGGTLILEATANGTVFSPIDFTSYVGGVVSNTLSASFFGRVSVEGLQAVRVRRSSLGVTFGSVTLTVFGG